MALRRVLRRFFPAVVTKRVTVTVVGELKISLTPSPRRTYVGRPVDLTVEWSINGNPGGYGLAEVDWGDGDIDHAEGYSPIIFSHVYGRAGSYTITVRVEDYDYGVSGSETTSVEIKPALSVDLAVSPSSGTVPLTVTFTCTATGGFLPYVWKLDFGDGSSPASGTRTSEGSWTVTHTYSKVGSYTAVLTVEDALGESVQAVGGVGAAVPQCPLWMRRLYETAVNRGFKRLQETLLRMAERRNCSLT